MMELNLSKRNDSIEVQILSNGFVVKLGGRNSEGDWVTRSVYTAKLEGISELLSDYLMLEES